MKRIFSLAINEISKIVQREINYFRIKPTYALLFMTYRCTSHCKICAIWQRHIQVEEELTLKEWQDILDSLHVMGVRHIEFFGGDAILRKDILIPLISYAHNKGIFTEMPTNCNLLDRNTALDLVRSGLNAIWISLDGIEETHDEIRGTSGTFSRAHRAIEELRVAKGVNNKPGIFINCVVSKYNLKSFDELISYAQNMGIDAIDFEYVGEIPQQSISQTEFNGLHPTPFFISTNSSALLDRGNAISLKKKLADIRRTLKKKEVRINTSKIDMLSVDNIVSGTFPNKRCYICRDWITIDPYGNVIGCLHFNNCYLGNAKKNDLVSIWKGMKHISFINSRDKGKFDICKFCSNGAIRNNTPLQSLQSKYYEITGKSNK